MTNAYPDGSAFGSFLRVPFHFRALHPVPNSIVNLSLLLKGTSADLLVLLYPVSRKTSLAILAAYQIIVDDGGWRRGPKGLASRSL